MREFTVAAEAVRLGQLGRRNVVDVFAFARILL